MKIALVSALFPPYAIGGAEKVAAELARALQLGGHQVDVVSTCRREDVSNHGYRVDEWEGIRVWRVAPWNLYWNFDKADQNPNGLIRAGWHMVDLWNPSVFHPLHQVLDQIQPDVVNTHNIDGFSPALWQAARRHTGAIAHTLHDCHLICTRATMRRRDGTLCSQRLCSLCRVYAAYHTLFRKHVSLLISPTRTLAELHRQFGWSDLPIEVVPNAVEVPRLQEEALPDSGPLRILFMSRLEQEKGCETLLSVVPLFSEGSGVEFHLAGSGTYEDRFAQLAGKHDHVRWHGFVSGPSKYDLLRSSDVFLQLSECHDNAPLSLVEARQSGLRLVGTEVGGIPELISGPQYGDLIRPGDTQALYTVLRSMADNTDNVRRERQRRLASIAPYGFHEMATGYVRAFSSLLPDSL
jgi:glycosyltransferase involved in cell wall biosynthesis